MSADFWAGTALTIPLALIAWLIQRALEPLLNQYGRRNIERRNKDVEVEYKLVASLVVDRDSLVEYILFVLLRLAVVNAFIGLISSSLNAIEMILGYLTIQFWRDRSDIIYIAGLIQQVVSVALVLYVVRLASKALTVYRRTKQFDDYKAQVAARLGHLPEH